MKRFTTFRPICLPLMMISALGASSNTRAQVVIGNWETGDANGWIDWNTGSLQNIAAPRFAFNATGATVGTGALQYNHPAQGFSQWAAIKLQLGTPGGDPIGGNGIDEWRDDFMANAKLAFDLTLVASEMAPGAGNDFAAIGLVVNAHDYGFTSQGNPDSVTPFTGFNGGNSFNPQLLVGTQTSTWTWDISDTHDGVDTDINPNPFYVELVFDTFSNGGVVYHIDNVRLFTPSLGGDFDNNDLVDGADLSKWTAGFGSSGQTDDSNGDADADGDVDGGDYLIWQRHVGETLGPPAVTAAPEPATACMALAAAVGAVVRRRRSSLLQ